MVYHKTDNKNPLYLVTILGGFVSYLTTKLGSFMRPLSDQQAAIRNVLEADLDDDDDDEVTITPNRRKKGTSKENADPNTLGKLQLSSGYNVTCSTGFF